MNDDHLGNNFPGIIIIPAAAQATVFFIWLKSFISFKRTVYNDVGTRLGAWGWAAPTEFKASVLSSSLIPPSIARRLRDVGRIAHEANLEAYAVGGLVRDLIMQRPTTDIDFVTVGSGTGIALAQHVGKALRGSRVHVYKNYGTAAVRIPARGDDAAIVLEFVAARRESYQRNSRKPRVEDGTLIDDLRRRDFTVNALAMHVHPARFGEIVDPFGGLQDLARGLLKTPLPAQETFDDDPLRMVRAARFAAQLNFEIHDDALAAMTAHAARLAIVSQERITDEVQKIIMSAHPDVGFTRLLETGLLTQFLPELEALKGAETRDGIGHKDNFTHTLKVLENVIAATNAQPPEATRWLRWAALFHDIAKPRCKRFDVKAGWTFHGHEDRGARMVPGLFRKLKLPIDERMEYVQKLVRLHHRPIALVDDHVTDSAVRRLLFDAGNDIEDLMTLVRADVTSKNPRRVRKYLNAFDHVDAKLVEVEANDQIRNFQPPLRGEEIMEALGVSEGLAVGIVKTRVREAILDGAIANDHEAAVALMMTMVDDAVRRGALFDKLMHDLKGRERTALGPIKELLVHHELPENDAAAIELLLDRGRRANPEADD